MLGLEQFSGYTAEDILNFIFATYPSHLVKQKTALDLYEAINSYQEREYIEYLMSKRNNQQQTEDATGKEEIQTPTSPTEYTYTEIKVVKSASTNIDIYADASGSSQKVGTITKYSKVAIQRQCNETGWYEVIAIPMINNKLVAEFAVQGYIHPDAYPYLYDKMNTDGNNSI